MTPCRFGIFTNNKIQQYNFTDYLNDFLLHYNFIFDIYVGAQNVSFPFINQHQ